jgi:hypothetical protein
MGGILSDLAFSGPLAPEFRVVVEVRLFGTHSDRLDISKMKIPFLKFLMALLALALLAAACGSDDSDESAAASDEMSDTDENMAMDEDMNMGDPDATPAYQVEGADLVTGTFILLETRPEGYDDLIGEAYIARYDDGTTVSVEIGGLLPDVEYISHLHEGSCEDNGGDHYKFDLDGSDMPPNEIHLAFVSSASGQGFMTAENHMVAGEEAQSVVVHPVDLLDNKIACAPL